MKTFTILTGLAFAAVVLVATAQTDFPAALNTSGLTWSSSGNIPWSTQVAVSHDGSASAKSGRIQDSQQSILETTVAGPGIVAFWWKASSEGGWDFLKFSIGGGQKAAISGESNWKRVLFDVPSGTQTLRWTFSKDGATGLGDDAGYLDEVIYAKNEGPPGIVLQPADKTVAAGATVTLRAGISGADALNYQWYFNETNLLVNGTSATLTLNNVQPSDTGTYRVAVTNSLGSIVTGPTYLSVSSNGPPENILVYSDGSSSSPLETALIDAGRTYKKYDVTGLAAFDLAVEKADPAKTLVIMDTYNGSSEFADLINYVRDGGRAIFQHWELAETGVTQYAEVATAFNARVSQPFSTPVPVYNWGGTLFTGITSPLTFNNTFGVDGQRLTVLAGGQALAGFTTTATSGQAAVIRGNSGRTIINGFFFEEAVSAANATRMAQNEIELLVGPPVITPPTISAQPHSQKAVVGGTVTFNVSASGTPPLSYQWYRNQSEALPGQTSLSLTLSGVQTSDNGTYRLQITNAQGSTNSIDATLSVSELGKVNSMLLMVDLPTSNPYHEALNNLGFRHDLFTGEGALSPVLQAADPANTMVIIDAPKFGRDLRDVTAFVNAGGRAIVEYWAFASDSNLSTSLGINVSSTFSFPQPVYDWGGSTVFSGLTSPLQLIETEFVQDGEYLGTVGSATALGGFTTGTVFGQAGVVLANSDRTIANGFAVEDVSPRSSGVKLIENEIELLAGPAPATAPFISVQPQNQTIVLGATALLSMTAVGTAPLSYQWYFNDAQRLDGQTNATLRIDNVAAARAGTYRVAVTNEAGSVLSDRVTLRLVGLDAVTNILLYVDDPSGTSPFRTALNALGRPYQLFLTDNPFDSAVSAADLQTTLAIMDCSTNAGTSEFKGLEAFARSGGRALLQYWSLTSRPTLAEAFHAIVLNTMSSPLPVYAWNNSALFAGVSTPISLTPGFLTTEGLRLDPILDGVAEAGFVSSPTGGQAAIVTANSGRTILHGFYLKEAVSPSAASRFAQNELQSLLAIRSSQPSISFVRSVRIDDGQFDLGLTGSPGITINIDTSADLHSWQPLGTATETAAGQFSFRDTQAPGNTVRFYRARFP